jgi:Methyltransferase domain
MDDWPARYPALAGKHLRDARLFASRNELVAAMRFLEGGVIAEVGVRKGDFSQVLLRILKPSRLVAFDTFSMHEFPFAFGSPTEKLFRGKTHLEYYRERFSRRGGQVVIEPGWSHVGLARHPDGSFDLVYLDAGRHYEIVRRDIDLAKRKIKEGGILVFAGYMMFDHRVNEPLGVVPAVNELVVGEDWRVFGLSLHREMYCNIAVRR